MAIVAFLLSTPARAAAQGASEVVVFGDSLSDSGNAFALRGAASTPPDYALDPFLIPGAPHARADIISGRHPGSSNWPARWGLRQRRAGVSIARGGCA